jgi:ABC-2 type transport system permease protein
VFSTIFISRLKCLLRNRVLVFWTLLFPIILAILYNMSLRNIGSSESFHPIPIAVVNDATYQNDASFRAALESASVGENQVFALTETTKENAAKLLADGKIEGYLTAREQIGMTVNKSDLDQSIIQLFLDSYLQTSSAAGSILKTNPSAYEKMAAALKTQTDYLVNQPVGSAAPDNTFSYFYALIAMTCLYGSFWGIDEVTNIQADQSDRAARINLVPVHKLKIFLSSLSAAFVINFAEILILLAFLRYGLQVDFGSKTGFVILTAFVGCLTGLSLGAVISAFVKTEGLKIGVSLAVTMVGSVLAGMMYQGIKYFVQQHAPLVGYLNPVNLLTDAFYSLYYYSGYERYWLNIGLLCAFTAMFCIVTYLVIRRRKYASL